MVLSHPLGLVLPRAHLCTHLPDDSSCCIPDTGDLRVCKATASISPESIHRNLTTMALPPSHEIRELERNTTRNLREEMRALCLLFDHSSPSMEFPFIHFMETSQKQSLGRFVQPWLYRRGPSWQGKAQFTWWNWGACCAFLERSLVKR